VAKPTSTLTGSAGHRWCSRRKLEVEVVAPGADAFEADGNGAGLVVDAIGVGAHGARADEEERAGVPGVGRRGDGVVHLKRLVEIADVRDFFRAEGEAGEIVLKDALDTLALFFIALHGEAVADGAGEGAVAEDGDVAFECAVSGEVEGGFAIDSGGGGREDGELDDLAVRTGGQESPAALLVGGKLADGDVFIGGIEDEVAAAVLSGNDGLEAGSSTPLGFRWP